ncbi:FAD/NAD(P)-binding protein [Streptomyces kronopolitis]|uniref:FAD/NAD(P)-binding protein n=1 Tax=Streptomyces kronopolitis TaxID=1612435 RepID=UPI003D967C56
MNPDILRVVVAGAGAAGTLAAARLLDAAARTSRRTIVDLVDPATDTGRGLAYSTTDPRHLLNVPAGRMSACPDASDDFVRWLSAREGRDADPDAYVPRALFGAYLADSLDRSAAAAYGTAAVRRWHDRVVAVDRPGHAEGGVRLRLRTGATMDAHAAVLALGNIAPGSAWLPPDLANSPRVVADPWRPGALADVPADRDVLLVGTGLTMCDMALTLAHQGRTVHAVSRHGLLPQAHATEAPAAPTSPQTERRVAVSELSDLTQLKRGVRYRAALYRRLYGDWRPAVDELRPHIPLLWQQLPAPDQQRFLAVELREWEVHRHRLPPATNRTLAAARQAGLLIVCAAEITAAHPADGGRAIAVQLSDGRALTVGAVINCTGTENRVQELADPLVRDLLTTGIAAPGPHGLGFDTTSEGRLVEADGCSTVPVWTLGQLRRGNLWETTAIPEIRSQAGELAWALMHTAVPAPV